MNIAIMSVFFWVRPNKQLNTDSVYSHTFFKKDAKHRASKPHWLVGRYARESHHDLLQVS